MTNIVIRWAGPADATSGSTYKIERTLDNTAWTTLAAAQVATTPYASTMSTLNTAAAYGDTTIALANAALFPTSGFLWLDDALVEWSGKTDNNLTGCVWRSGYGTYLAGSRVYRAHESYSDEDVTISNGAALYRITHNDAAGNASPPAYLWYYYPPMPASNRHCVVVVSIATDLGIEARSGLGVQAYLAADTEFSDFSGAHLDKAQSAAKTQTTNAFGLAFFQCWKNSVRSPVAGNDAGYVFVLDSGSADKLTVEVAEIPDRDWVLLSHIATDAS